MNFNINQYHQATKHSYMSIRTNPNYMDWNNQPSVFIYYPSSFTKFDLDLEKESHRFIYNITGLTAKKTYPGVEYYLRTNPSAGALYPNEIYFQVKGEKDFEDGIYHFENATSKITLLYSLKDKPQEGIESSLNQSNAIQGFIFLISSIYYRSSWKYKNRAFRYCLLDGGHLLGSIEASVYIHNRSYEILYDFNINSLNNLFNFTNEEFFLSAVICGKHSIQTTQLPKLSLPWINSTGVFEQNEIIEKAYENTINISHAKKQEEQPLFHYDKSIFEEAILKRRSIRNLNKKSIKKEEFLHILNLLKQPIPNNCDEEVDIYCVLNRIEGMPLGLFKDTTYIKEGDFQKQAGYLCLEQALGKDSAVTFFLISKSKNYQAMYQKAGIIGHRLYLVSTYLNMGCSGIGAYYDDEVLEFLGLQEGMVLYALALGK